MSCPNCGDWPLTAEDRFCPQCGGFVARVRLDLADPAVDGRKVPILTLESPLTPALRGMFLAFLSGGADDRALVDEPDLDFPLDFFADGSTGEVPDLSPGDGASTVVTVHPAIEVGGRRRVSPERLATLQFNPPAGDVKLLSAVVQADAIEQDRWSTGAWARVRVENRGEATTIASALLRVDKQPRDGAPAPAASRPTLLTPGKVVVVRAWLAEPDWRAIRTLSAPLGATLELRDTVAREISPGQRVRIARRGEMRVDLESRRRIAALAGRRIRLPARLKNRGGQIATVVASRLVLSDGATIAGGPEGGWRARLEPGEVWEEELTFPSPSAPGVSGVRLEMDLADEDGETSTQIRVFDLEVRPADTPLRGRLCVDFGTTESGVALALGEAPSRGNEGDPDPPWMIDLARASVDGCGKGDRFLPSRGARLKSGKLLFGRAAAAAAAADVDKRLADFKWALKREEDFRVAVAYLQTLKALVEDHPDVAAVVGPETTVFATCPTRFAPGLRARLRAALRAAGFADPLTDVFNASAERPGILIAESWSPVSYALIDNGARFEPLGIDPDVERPVLRLDADNPVGHIVIFDIGGGSADISVLRTELKGGKREIVETFRRTDRDFIGLKFSERIAVSLQTWLRQTGRGVVDHDRDALIRTFQFAEHDPADAGSREGVFAVGPLRELIRGHFSRRLAGSSADGDLKVIRDALSARPVAGEPGTEESRFADSLRRRFDGFAPLALGAPGGGQALDLSADQIVDLSGRIVADFAARYLRHIKGLMDETLAAPLREGGPMILIPSGRGAAYPLAWELLVQAWRLKAGDAHPVSRLMPGPAKAITSWGGLDLADRAAAGHLFSIDLKDDQYVLAFAGRDMVHGIARHQIIPWVGEPGDAGGVAAARLFELGEGVIVRRKLVLSYGDPDGLDADPIGVIGLSPDADESRDHHWLVVEIDKTEGLSFGWWVVAAANEQEAVRTARSQEAGDAGRS